MSDALVTINVTAEHIAAGKRGACVGCPVALGIEIAVAAGIEVQVGLSGIDLRAGDAIQSLDTPWRAKEFIRLFDATGFGRPFTFPLAIRREFLR